ncbi:MAG: FAD-dependent oxidoreductase [Anaerolineae bacterium]|nr:FAD-dependent oxidoreductase [Anaerolineae bacterium]
MTRRIVVVGAGIGGLSAAALLAKAGLDVTVLEAHVYPGGCAGTFFHGGYRFDAGATLAAGFEPGGGMTRLGEMLGIEWPVEPAETAMRVHLPGGQTVTGVGRRKPPGRCGMWRCAARPGLRRTRPTQPGCCAQALGSHPQRRSACRSSGSTRCVPSPRVSGALRRPSALTSTANC